MITRNQIIDLLAEKIYKEIPEDKVLDSEELHLIADITGTYAKAIVVAMKIKEKLDISVDAPATSESPKQD